MEFKRDIYKKLLAWKQDDSGRVMQVSGERFIKCLNQAEEWKPGTPMSGEPVHEAIRLFYQEFRDDKDTVIIIDEIQESSRVFNLVRTFAEFAEVFGKRDAYDSADLFGGSDAETYKGLKELYELYQRIGGYPSVVNIYLEHKSLERCDVELRRLMGIFTNESKRYFG